MLPHLRKDRIYTVVCWSKENGTGKNLGQSGFVVVLDRKTKKVISALGGNEPIYKDGKLQPYTKLKKPSFTDTIYMSITTGRFILVNGTRSAAISKLTPDK